MKKYLNKIVIVSAMMTVSLGIVSCGAEDNQIEEVIDITNSETIDGEYEYNLETFDQLTMPEVGEEYAIIHTNYGDISMKLLEDEAPLAVENFVTHAKEGYYDGLIFHRVIDGFVMQGGDPTGTGTAGESIYGEPFVNEVTPTARHFGGSVAMANAGPDTNTSQFYIVDYNTLPDILIEELNLFRDDIDMPVGVDKHGHEVLAGDIFNEDIIDGYINLGGQPMLDFGYTVFGQVFDGQDVVVDVTAVETGAMDKPVEDVIIENIEITEMTQEIRDQYDDTIVGPNK